jgi:glucosamine--fructose-6-phosphate aminotransferase (isomerizing)
LCGIVGYIGKREAVPILIDSLKRQEYRGYDSAGIAVISNGRIEVLKKKGKISELEVLTTKSKIHGTIGIGHTRWATHGKPSDENAHPHIAGSVAVVHNGIIENYLSLREMLLKKKRRFNSQTDTEIIAHLIDNYIVSGLNFEEALRRCLKDLRGSFAIAVINKNEPDCVFAGRLNSPLIIGVGEGENFVASDIPAILPYTNRINVLNDGEIACLKRNVVTISDFDGRVIKREPKKIYWTASMAEKEGYAHFMEKEIFEQPRAIVDTLRGRYSPENGEVKFDNGKALDSLLDKVQKIFIVSCGTSYHAGLVGKYLIEGIAGVGTEVDIASEFRYRNPVIDKHTLVVSISQSGETADTLASIREAKARGARTLSICNVLDSSIPRESHYTLYTRAGPEIGVASTKAFVTQLVVLLLFALNIAKKTKAMSVRDSKKLLEEVLELPKIIESILKRNDEIRELAKKYYSYSHFLYLGRGISFPIALEGALKLKEISYIHAEAYAAGEMKHGPIALIDEKMPSFFICPESRTYDKVVSNMEEVKARNGKIIALATDGDKKLSRLADDIFYVPEVNEYILPPVLVVPLQLFAYHIAVLKGTDVDQPRNLAKSVTVE